MTTKKIIAVITLLALLNGILGCSSVVLITPDELKRQPQKKILAAKVTSGEEINFEAPGGVFFAEEQVIQGTIRDTTSVSPYQVRGYAERVEKYYAKDVEIKLNDISYVKVKKIDAGRTIGCILGTSALGIGLCVLIALLTFELKPLGD
ncbi:MAG: hypothetical protein AMJ92_00540 [candidate division Zixibacteria bacterium SM23_81]|nr:MAG: hypothetical protein AMJ92_00540 [candidate division Zixibacteria bacterium SM23_81]